MFSENIATADRQRVGLVLELARGSDGTEGACQPEIAPQAIVTNSIGQRGCSAPLAIVGGSPCSVQLARRRPGS